MAVIVSAPTCFVMGATQVSETALVPRYYNPAVAEAVHRMSVRFECVTLGDLVAQGHVALQPGTEPGKMAYGTGDIPFIRTSDISSWELRSDPKQTVSYDIYLKGRRRVAPGDILFVRDGTYLIGSAAMVTSSDGIVSYQSHVVKITVAEGSPYPAGALLAALSSPVVRLGAECWNWCYLSTRTVPNVIASIGV
jgi:type I restriction enzyme M protein